MTKTLSPSASLSELGLRRAWTALITNANYLNGLLTLDFALKKVRSRYPLVTLYTDDLAPEALHQLKIRGIPSIKIKNLQPVNSSSLDYSNDPRFADCWSKLQCFALYQFEKVVQLDVDMVVLKNMDELFDIQLDGKDAVFAAGHACVCNPYRKEHYPKDWIPENCVFTSKTLSSSVKNTGTETDDVLGPQPHESPLQVLNGGLLVVKPNEEAYNKIVQKLETGHLVDYSFPDQDLLADVFRSKWVGLSFKYNYLKPWTRIHKSLDFNAVKNIHYILTPKPWEVDHQDYHDDTNTFKYWWDINQQRLDFENKAQDI